MKRDERDRWCEALRSGKYVQGIGSLHNRSGYCCLGVWLEVEGVQSTHHDANVCDSYDFGVSGETHMPNEQWASEHGVSWDDMEHCAELNDTNQSTFEEIADWIEENL